jgi:two-component system chemotaxis sensor kinase CheA
MTGKPDELQELVADFVTESREHLRTVETDLLRLEEGGSDAETVNNVFRCVHSVKGVAGFLGLDRIQALAHSLESTLDQVRKGRLEPTPHLVGALLGAIDGLREMIEDVTNSNAIDIAPLTTALQQIIDGDGSAPPAPHATAAPTVDPDEPAPAAPEVQAPTTDASLAAAPTAGDAKAEAAPARRDAASSADTDSIRVNVGLLNRLMTLSGEMVLGRNQVLQTLASDNHKALVTATGNLSQVVSEMQEAIMQTRLQPVGQVFQKLPRIVRDLTTKLGKRCKLVVDGKDVELDRSILEALGDPLTHLVRNAIDHGIEKPERRRSNGKNPEGTLSLTAFHQGGNVKIEIVDDGGGIDPQVLRKKAVEKGLITPDQARSLNDRDAILLIFAPGFSTAEKVSDVSGRGVGMDVVRSNIEKLGGHVEVDTVLGKGTTFTVTIPLTLAIMPALVVTCSERRYVLPQNNVTELVRIRPGDQEHRTSRIQGREVLKLRGALLPVVHLRDALQVADDDAQRAARPHNIMVVQTGALRYGLVVDTPPDTEEIVVKPLGRHFKGRAEYSGSTILGDGRVAMILDVAGLAATANLRSQSDADAELAADGNRSRGSEDTTSLVLFRNHPDELFAVPLGLVSRIQRIEASAIAQIGDSLVHQTTERAMPMLHLHEHVRARAPERLGERWSVLVLRLQGREFGLVTSVVEDIRALSIQVDDRTLAGPGIVGSFQLGDKPVRILDVTAIARQALPHLFVEEPPAVTKAKAGREDRPQRILFAEDSTFFRNHAASVLRGGGYEVVTAEDGEIAFRLLGEHEGSIDLLLTDVQMPNCDGIELTRRVRAAGRFGNLPIVALTSLSTDEDVANARAAGVNEYLVKLDDSALLAAVRGLIGSAR